MKFQRQNDIPGLDGLRGILAIWLFFFHARLFDKSLYLSSPNLLNFVKGGPIGVDGFFALSGFIITHVYQKNFHPFMENFKFLSFLKVYVKFLFFRVGRIWPLHALMSLYWVKPFSERCSITDYLMEITFTTPIMKPTVQVGICNPASWSIVNEFYAYFAFPLLYYILIKLNKNNSVMKNIAVIILVFGSLLIMKFLWHFVILHELEWVRLKYFDIDMTIFEFFVGMATYKIYDKYPRKHWINDLLFVSVLVLISFLCIILNYIDYYNYYSYLVLILPLLLTKTEGYVAMFFRSEILKFLGEISFSLYLSHTIWIGVFKTHIGVTGNELYVFLELAFIMFFSYFGYIFYETPIRNLFRKVWEYFDNSPPKSNIIPPKQKTKLFDPKYGFCSEDLFEEIYGRLVLVRQKIFLAEKPENLRKEQLIPDQLLADLCLNIPINENELKKISQSDSGQILLRYKKWILEEIINFMKANGIDKEEYLIQDEKGAKDQNIIDINQKKEKSDTNDEENEDNENSHFIEKK